ncbi:MAG: hypothetical protein V3U88_03805, partial [Methylococcales bacterium]
MSYVTVAATPKTDNKTSQLSELFHARSLVLVLLPISHVISQRYDSIKSIFSISVRTEDLIKHETITQNFYFRSDELKRRIVVLRNDLSSSELGEKDKLEFRV